jgi:Tol biopolymer transport system component
MKVGIDPITGRLASSPIPLLTGLGKNNSSPISLTQDGRNLVYTKDDTYGNLWLWSIESQGRQRASRTLRLTSGTVNRGWPVLSPDGQTLAFAAPEGGSVNLFTLSVSGDETRPRQLTFFRSWDSQIGVPAWSPDGKEIAFVSGEGGVLRVWRIPATGGSPRPFPRSEPSEFRSLIWAPGAQILYQRPRNRNFHFLDPVTEEERPLLADDSAGFIHYPRYAPDGKRLVVWWDRAGEGPSLQVISLTDGAQTTIAPSTSTIDPRPVGWSDDGQWIYVFRRAPGGGEILRFPSAGGAPEPWGTATFGRDAICPSMALDGRRFACMVEEGQTDGWLIEDFDAPPAQTSR